MAAAAAAASSFNLAFLRRPILRPLTASRCLPPSRSVSVSTLHLRSISRTPSRVLAVAEEEGTAVIADDKAADGFSEEAKSRSRLCQLYVCNLPRSCDVSHLSDLFNPYGSVISLEISRDAETGISRGCGYITMSTIPEAKAAIAALDGTDLGGREIRVKFSVDMISGRTKTETLNTAPKKDIVFESPHKVYVGNLAWSVRPEDLRSHFSQFGAVLSARVLYDRKGGKNRVYGFLSFSSADELKAAIGTSGSVFHGRTVLVREVVNRE